jgi:hypothetical protein
MIRSLAVVLLVAIILLICDKNFVGLTNGDKQNVSSYQKEFLIASTQTTVPLEHHVFTYVVRNSAKTEKKFKLIMAPDLVEQNRTA